MYHALLANRYLTSRVIPLIAVAAVALCTALVIIVVSVMSGFVEMVRSAGKTLIGDVVVMAPVTGMPHYERLVNAFEALDVADAASPSVDAYGLLQMPYGGTRVVTVWGIEPQSFAEVTRFDDTLVWKEVPEAHTTTLLVAILAQHWSFILDQITPQQRREIEAIIWVGDRDLLTDRRMSFEDRRIRLGAMGTDNLRRLLDLLNDDLKRELFARDRRLVDSQRSNREEASLIFREGLALRRFGSALNDSAGTPGAVIGIHVSEANQRQRDGSYAVIGRWWMPTWNVTLSVLPVSPEGRPLDPADRIFPVVNESQSGVFMVDERSVFIPLQSAQEMLRLDAAPRVDPNDLDEFGNPRIIGEVPARVTMILVKAREGISPEVLKARVMAAYDQVRDELFAEGTFDPLPGIGAGALVQTWEERQRAFIGPVEKERDLMRILFSIVYIVCAGLVLVIFWAIVYEKTRDIGILRSVGASRFGILWIFVRYGLFVGVVGAIIGLGLAWLVVRNINTIHETLGEPFPLWLRIATFSMTGILFLGTIWCAFREALLPVVVLTMLTIALAGVSVWITIHPGFLVWDPAVYYFAQIPNEVDHVNALITMVGAIIFSAIGALIPASRAGDIDPVHALRYE